jgi:hypothetical protein
MLTRENGTDGLENLLSLRLEYISL